MAASLIFYKYDTLCIELSFCYLQDISVPFILTVLFLIQEAIITDYLN